jgi:hypothetical protein
MMKEIPLTQDKVALVDDEDYEYLYQFNWHTSTYRELSYAKRNVRAGTSHTLSRMHREIFEYRGIDLTGLEVDHINGDGLDNRRSNLRIATHKENLANCAKRSATKDKNHGLKGITFNPKKGRWTAQITVNGVHMVCGDYNTPEEAANAYDEAAIKHFGEFAKTNDTLVNGENPITDSDNVIYSDKFRKKPKNTASKYWGVSFNNSYNKWMARIYVNGKSVYRGIYSTEVEAAKASNDAIREYFGNDDPRINKI